MSSQSHKFTITNPQSHNHNNKEQQDRIHQKRTTRTTGICNHPCRRRARPPLCPPLRWGRPRWHRATAPSSALGQATPPSHQGKRCSCATVGPSGRTPRRRTSRSRDREEKLDEEEARETEHKEKRSYGMGGVGERSMPDEIREDGATDRAWRRCTFVLGWGKLASVQMASHLYRVVAPPSINVRPTHLYLLLAPPPDTNVRHLYQLEPPPGTNVPTGKHRGLLLPTRYKCPHLYRRQK
jgi:hypothetical protein